jgi:hypothetical protein
MDFEPWKKHPQGDSEYLRRPDVQGHLKVQEVLREWDPIGVEPNKNLGCFDEYDGYAGQIMNLLNEQADIQDMVDWLCGIVLKHMGMSDFRSTLEPRTRELMEGLRVWWNAWKAQLDQT